MQVLRIAASSAIALGLMATFVGAQETPPHTIAVAGDVELLLPPDYASIELGVVTQAPIVSDALAENSERMTRVVEAVKSLGISDKEVRTSTFSIEPKYEKSTDNDYDTRQYRTIIGYYISNKITVRVRDLGNVAKIIDNGVKAGANASGMVSFDVDALSARLDEARRKAMDNAHHNAEVLATAAHMTLGPAISITDNRADRSYNNRAEAGSVEQVVVTASRMPTPIEPGLVSIHSAVTVLYALK